MSVAIKRGAAKGERRPMRYDRDGLRRCRVCGCTEMQACEPPCSWADEDLCSGCAAAASALVAWRDGAHHASLAALIREVEAQERYLWNKHRAKRSAAS